MQGNKYHTRFLNQFSTENIVGLFSRYKGSAKEVTESWGMLEAAKKINPCFSNTIVIIVGDGCSPRTGAIFAYNTKATVISVDPNMNIDHWTDHCEKQAGMGFPVRRLMVSRAKIEDFIFDCQGRDCIVVFPHSHADMRRVYVENYGQLAYIAMPCCVPIPGRFQQLVHLTYDDKNILSPKRTVHIWHADEEFQKVLSGLRPRRLNAERWEVSIDD